MSNKDYIVNHRIKFPELRVISSDGQNIGVLKTQDALKLAIEKELDLVVISATAKPPIAKILDFNKYMYEERKKSSAAKAKSKKSEMKEFVFGPTIGEGDLMSRVERCKEFLQEGNRVKITVKMKGRENEHPEIALEKIQRFVKELSEIGKIESEPRRMGTMVNVIFLKK